MSFSEPHTSLQHLCCLSFSKRIWNVHQNALKVIFLKDILDISREQRLRACMLSLKVAPQYAAIPKPLKQRVTDYIICFGEHLYNVLSDFEQIVGSDILHHIDVTYLPLSAFGVVDKQAFAVSLLNSVTLDRQTRFRLACVTCDFKLVQLNPPSKDDLEFDGKDDHLLHYWHLVDSNASITRGDMHGRPWFTHEFIRGSNQTMMYFYNALQHYTFKLHVKFTPSWGGFNLCEICMGQRSSEKEILYFHHSEYFISNAIYFIVNVYVDFNANPIPANLWFSLLCRPSLQWEATLAAFDFVLRIMETPERVSHLKTEFDAIRSAVVSRNPGNAGVEYNTCCRFVNEYYECAIEVIDNVLSDL